MLTRGIRGLLMCLLVWLAPVSFAAQKATPKPKGDTPMAKIVDDPKLPRVLLIGDSISIGYTVPVRKLLHGKANVHRALTNCGPTSRGVAQIDKWLGNGRWDVIHFNFGLHDLHYVTADGKLKAPDGSTPTAENGRYQVPPEEYEKNLRTIVARLKKTGAKLIWCTTTPVPAGSSGRTQGDQAKFNAIAAKVMADEKIPTDDLCSFAAGRLEEIQLKKNVHFTAQGYRELAQVVAKSIEGALAAKPE